MDIDKYPEISVDLFYSKSVTTPRCIAGTKAKTVHEQLPGGVQEAVKFAKSSSIKKERVNERKRNVFTDTSKIQSKKAKLESDNAVLVDHNYNILKDPAQHKRSKPFTIFLSKNIDDDSDDDSDDEMEKSIKDYEENALKHDKVEKKKKSELPARYLSSNISFHEGIFNFFQ